MVAKAKSQGIPHVGLGVRCLAHMVLRRPAPSNSRELHGWKPWSPEPASLGLAWLAFVLKETPPSQSALLVAPILLQTQTLRGPFRARCWARPPSRTSVLSPPTILRSLYRVGPPLWFPEQFVADDVRQVPCPRAWRACGLFRTRSRGPPPGNKSDVQVLAAPRRANVRGRPHAAREASRRRVAGMFGGWPRRGAHGLARE